MEELELIKKEELLTLGGQLSSVLDENKTSKENCLAAVNNYSVRAEAEFKSNGKLSPETLESGQKLQLAVKNTIKKVYDKRTPLTGILNKVTKLFTGVEKELSEADAKLQELFNQDVKAKKIESDRKLAEEQLKLNKGTELVSLKADFERQLSVHFNNHISDSKEMINGIFESATIKNFDEIKEEVSSFPVNYMEEHFKSFRPVRMALRYLDVTRKNDKSESNPLGTPNSQDDVVACNLCYFEVVSPEKLQKFKNEFNIALQSTKDDLVMKFPGKLEELNKIENARLAAVEAKKSKDAEALKRANELEIQLQKEAETRKKIAEDNAKLEAENRAKTSENEISNEEAGAHLNTVITNEENTATILEEAPAVVEGYEIIVTSMAGWMKISAFYFNKGCDGKSVDQMEKVTFAAMKTFAEKMAKINKDERIVHEGITYVEVIKAKTLRNKK